MSEPAMTRDEVKCVRCGISDGTSYDCMRGDWRHDDRMICIDLLRERLAAVERERDALREGAEAVGHLHDLYADRRDLCERQQDTIFSLMKIRDALRMECPRCAGTGMPTVECLHPAFFGQAEREDLVTQLVYAIKGRQAAIDRADRTERILSALREPSDRVVEYAACTAEESTAVVIWINMHEDYRYQVKAHVRAALRAAVAAAEREVDRA